MDDMQAIEQRISQEMLRRAGPSEPVDDLAIFDAVVAGSQQKRWGITMFSALKFVAASAIVALFGGFLLAGVLTTQQGDEVAPAAVSDRPALTGSFPTGLFVANEDGDWSVEFREDGTCRWLDPDRQEITCKFAVNGDLYTEMSFEPWDMAVKTPATFSWEWDGQTLSFERWEDAIPPRLSYTDHTFRLIPDPVEVVVAGRDAVAGYIVVPDLRYVSSAEAGPDAYTDVLEVKGRLAADDIPEGTPITEELLVPAAE
jgi:hypothetical protein